MKQTNFSTGILPYFGGSEQIVVDGVMREYRKGDKKQMGKVIYSVAISVDAFIAEWDGGVGWLETIIPVAEQAAGYEQFYKTIGSVVMGSTIYKQILGLGKYPYMRVESVVISTHTLPHPDSGKVRFK